MRDGLRAVLESPELQTLGWALIHSLWQGALVAGALLVLLRAVPRRAAQVRYWLCCAALAALIVVPVLTVRFGLDTLREHEACWAMAGAGTLDASHSLAGTCSSHGVAVPGYAPHGAASSGRSAIQRMSLEVGGLAGLAAGLWLLAGAVAGTWMACGYSRTRRLRSSALRPVDPQLARRARELAAQLRIRGRVEICYSGAVDVPTVVGWDAPVVLLPTHTRSTLDAEQLEAVLAHELAHIGRRDPLANLVQCALEALLFCNPAAHWISRRIREERECCCDQLAVDLQPGRVPAYLRALLALEELRTPLPARHSLALSGGALLSRARRLAEREAAGRRRLRPWQTALLAVAGGVFLALPLLDASSPAHLGAWVVMTRDLESRPRPESGRSPEVIAEAATVPLRESPSPR